MRPAYPFAALVGLDTLRLALRLAAIDLRLSVLIRGGKGAGKSTAVRSLAGLLAPGAPFVTLPIGATEDRLLGGLDIDKALKGEPALKPGLIAQAHGGVLYIDEVNLLADHLADALLDAVAGGVHVVERDGLSASHASDFVLLGSMNPEEGPLRPQLLDRFALVVDVEAPADPEARCEVLDRRLSFDRDPQRFAAQWAAAQAQLGAELAAARRRAPAVGVSRQMLRHVAGRIAEHDVRSLRADLAVIRASAAYAALLHAEAVTPEHIETVLPLALAHRVPRGSGSRSRHQVAPLAAPPVPASPPAPLHAPLPAPPTHTPLRSSDTSPAGDRPDDDAGRDPSPFDFAQGDPSGVEGRRGSGAAPPERVFAAIASPGARLEVEHRAGKSGAAVGAGGVGTGPVVRSRPAREPRELDLHASLVHAASGSVAVGVRPEDLHERVRAPRAGCRYILIVDSSGSHAVGDRMRLVKGAVAGLLDASHRRHDEVVVIGCRGPSAEILVAPTSSKAEAERALEYLPTGGRTPLAHALELASAYVDDRAALILVTDGHANVPTQTDDAWADAQRAAVALHCPSLVVDTEDPAAATGRPRQLAAQLGGAYARIEDLEEGGIVRLAQAAS